MKYLAFFREKIFSPILTLICSHCEPFSLEYPEKLPAATHCDVHPFNLHAGEENGPPNDNNAFATITPNSLHFASEASNKKPF